MLDPISVFNSLSPQLIYVACYKHHSNLTGLFNIQRIFEYLVFVTKE